MEALLGIIVGLGLAAACGFRVFVPLLVVSIAAATGHLQLAPGFAWLGSPLAVVMLVTATGLEVGGYYIPWVDNLLDSVATPASVVAGALVSAAYITGMSPELSWGLTLIVGGTLAGAVQVATVGARAVSTATTGGLGNPVVATVELVTSGVIAIASVVWPIIAAVFVVLAVAMVVWVMARRRRGMGTALASPVT